jgi:hypothetical protein
MEHFLRHWVAGVYGLLVDQAGAFTEAGGQIVAGSHGRSYAVVGGKAYPLLCGDIVPWQTEDGMSDGRCGKVAVDHGQCPAHAAERDYWQDLSPREQQAIEQAEEAWA